MRPLDIDAICQRIAVSAPYFAYRSLELDDDATLYGSFIPEQPLDYERGPVSAAEVGRHLAILGACAASASLDTTKIYYLATEANYTRLREPICTSTTEPLRASATVIQHRRRALAVDTTLSDSVPFPQLKVSYQILTESLFARLFAQHRMAPPTHTQTWLALRQVAAATF